MSLLLLVCFKLRLFKKKKLHANDMVVFTTFFVFLHLPESRNIILNYICYVFMYSLFQKRSTILLHLVNKAMILIWGNSRSQDLETIYAAIVIHHIRVTLKLMCEGENNQNMQLSMLFFHCIIGGDKKALSTRLKDQGCVNY